jgi:outer membrane protein, heavy metal efflux system
MKKTYSLWLFAATLLSSHTVLAQEKLLAQANAEIKVPNTTLELPPLPIAEKEKTETKPEVKTPDVLTLQEAIDKALTRAPRLTSTKANIAANIGEHTQAGLWQNPTVTLTSEDFAGSGQYRGFTSPEVTLGISQPIEIGGKIESRVAVADQNIALARLRHTVEQLDVIRDTLHAYTNAVATQETLKLFTEQKELADNLFKEVRTRVEAAREPLIQRSKAEITLSTATFSEERAERELNHAKHVLSSLWGDHQIQYDLAAKNFFELIPPMSETEAEIALEKSPAFKHYIVNQTLMKATYALEKAEAIPNPSVNIGTRHYRQTKDQAVVASVSFPFPVFNRNQGSIERAQQDIIKAEADKKAAKLAMVNALHEALETQVNAYRQADNLKHSILPAAEKAFTLSREGYRAGRFPYLEVLDAQRTLFQVKEQYIVALKEYHIAKADIERLTAYDAETYSMKENTHAQ